MPTPSAPSVALSLTRDEEWTLHHVLLDRIEAELTAATTDIDPPPLAVYTAFDTLDAGTTRFTDAELEAMRDVLGEYHHRTDWCVERDRLEQLLRTLTRALERTRPARDHSLADD
ncbi:hypothetical protein [Halosolutus halophilus]|uniref:DUF7853 family protein n=1 Tax=Halosolutus halophilus TaxID=1552990 RepID=UPI0022351079|nr:hypothetical protein [Halosolutus halophilus]